MLHFSNTLPSQIQSCRARGAANNTTQLIVRQSVRINYQNSVPPNKALKLRINAARVFAARQFAGTKLDFGTSAQRTASRHQFAAVSLAPVR